MRWRLSALDCSRIKTMFKCMIDCSCCLPNQEQCWQFRAQQLTVLMQAVAAAFLGACRHCFYNYSQVNHVPLYESPYISAGSMRRN